MNSLKGHMKQSKGTPKTLQEAIRNGIEQYKDSKVTEIVHDSHGDILAAFVATHVRDYLAQIFGVSYMGGALERVTAENIWKQIFPEGQK